MSRVVHFEFPTTDLAASRKFYENVFGWHFHRADMPEEYWLISTGDPGTPGIDGAMGGAAEGLKVTVNTVDVEDIDEALRKAQENGGEIIMPKDVIPQVGYIAYVREPGGNVVGIFQTLPNGGM